MTLGSLRISFVRKRPASAVVRRRGGWRSLLAASALALPTAAASAVPALADSSGGTTVTVNVAVRSLTVSPTSASFDACFTTAGGGISTGTVLPFPNGSCVTNSAANQITITNGPDPATIDVNGADAVPADGGHHWTLCTTVTCTGPQNLNPGVDQFSESDLSNGTSGPSLTNSPQCDVSISAGSCVAASGQVTREQLTLVGPKESTDNSSSFTTVWTWTAAP